MLTSFPQKENEVPEYINTSVPVETWKEAQVWERNFWFREQRNLKKLGKNYAWRVLAALGRVEKYRGDDNNVWWAKQFDNYSFLPPSAITPELCAT